MIQAVFLLFGSSAGKSRDIMDLRAGRLEGRFAAFVERDAALARPDASDVFPNDFDARGASALAETLSFLAISLLDCSVTYDILTNSWRAAVTSNRRRAAAY